MRFYHSVQYYEELFCCHADTACYTSLGQLTAPKLSTHRFTDSSLVEQDGLWSSSAPTHSPLTNPSARRWQREASPWSEAFQVEIASCCSRKKKKTEGKESCQHLCWDPWGSLQPFAVCHMSFQQEPGGGGVPINSSINYPSYKLSGDCILRNMPISSSKLIKMTAGTNVAS